MSNDLFAAILSSVGASAVTGLISWGINHEKVSRLQSDYAEMKETHAKLSTKEHFEMVQSDMREMKLERDKYVTLQHFDAVIGPLRHSLEDMKVDLKLVLKIIGRFNDR